MLELGQLVGQIGELASETKRRHEETDAQLRTGLEIAKRTGDDWAEHRSWIIDAQTTWLTALPIDDNPIGKPIDCPSLPIQYTAIAADGSQIPIDRHAAATYYVLNVGSIAIHYGTGERPHLQSEAELFYRESDLLLDGGSGEASLISEQTLATRRLVAECSAIKTLIKEHKSRAGAVALLDGTLILWAQEAERDDVKRETINQFMDMLNRARECHMPIAGYLSRPGSREVVNALRIALCPDKAVNCKPCAYTPKPCDAINRVSDAALFERILRIGQRSGLFASRSKVIDSYETDQRIAFFYVNVGAEVARVEVPLWVAHDTALIERTHSLVVDQALKGHGYPIALLEAHEQAIVRGPEREAFTRLIEKALIRHKLPIRYGRKALAKQARTL